MASPPPPPKKRPAKTPPPPGPPPMAKPVRRAVAPAQPEATKPLAAEDESPGARALRRMAAVEYATDQHQCSLAQLQSRPHYVNTVTLRTLEKWSVQDKWAEQRESFVRTWMSAVEQRMATALARQQIQQMESLEKILNKQIEKLTNEALTATTWEGAINGILRIMDKMDELRERVTGALIPDNVGSTAATVPTGNVVNVPAAARPVLTNPEARAAALTVIRMRREAMRKQLAVEDASGNSGNVEEMPTPVVVTQPVKEGVGG